MVVERGETDPSLDWFIYAFGRKEAVLSSQIEGTEATLVDLLTFEAEEQTKPNADVEEGCNYLDTLAYARGQMGSDDGLPLCLRRLGEAHRRLMSGVRGETRQPGEIRLGHETGRGRQANRDAGRGNPRRGGHPGRDHGPPTRPVLRLPGLSRPIADRHGPPPLTDPTQSAGRIPYSIEI